MLIYQVRINRTAYHLSKELARFHQFQKNGLRETLTWSKQIGLKHSIIPPEQLSYREPSRNVINPFPNALSDSQEPKRRSTYHTPGTKYAPSPHFTSAHVGKSSLLPTLSCIPSEDSFSLIGQSLTFMEPYCTSTVGCREMYIRNTFLCGSWMGECISWNFFGSKSTTK